ncbi:MAG: cytochrome c biogenesis protein CcdA [Minicystis sp.]
MNAHSWSSPRSARIGLSTRLAALAALAVLLLPATALADEPDLFTRLIKKGPLFGALGALAGGLLTAATPCVYPMIAITVSVFGAREAKGRGQAMLLSSSFVLGIVALFTPMIVGAALTGSLFGAALANKYVVLVIVTVFVAMAASMFGAFDLTLPESVMQRLNSVGGIGYGGAFLLGLVSGLVAAPCTGPVLTGILVWIGNSRDLFLGTIVGLMFSIGLGLPFWLVGTFAVSLPKGGKWMLGIKSFFGVVMLVVALWFLKNAFPSLTRVARPDTAFLAVSAVAVVIGLALGAVHLYWDDEGVAVRARKGIGIALCTAGGFAFIVGWTMPKGSLAWEHSEEVAIAKAKAEKRPILIDFTATWCGACQELAKDTFADPRVQARAVEANFVAVKVDATNDEDPQVDKIKDKYKVKGLPTVVIYDSTGAERKRFTEFVGPEPFLKAIEGVN